MSHQLSHHVCTYQPRQLLCIYQLSQLLSC